MHELTSDERAAVAGLLQDAIDADQSPTSPQTCLLSLALRKVDPGPEDEHKNLPRPPNTNISEKIAGICNEYVDWFAAKDFTQDWTSPHFPTWTNLLSRHRDKILRVLEIGSWEGRSAIFFLNFFRNCKITCIDTFVGGSDHQSRPELHSDIALCEFRFDANVAEYGARVEKIKSTSSQALAQLANQFRRYDLVYIDGSHESHDVYSDVALAWAMVSTGGIVIFDDYDWKIGNEKENRPKLGIDAFLSGHAGEFRELHRAWQIIIERTNVGFSGTENAHLRQTLREEAATRAAEHAETKAELAIAQFDLSDMESKLGAANAKLDLARSGISGLEAKFDAANMQLVLARSDVSERETKLAAAHADLIEARAALSASQIQARSEAAELAKSKADLAEANAALREWQDKEQRWQTEANTTSTELSRVKQARERAEESLLSRDAALHSADEANKVRIAQSVADKTEIVSLRQKLIEIGKALSRANEAGTRLLQKQEAAAQAVQQDLLAHLEAQRRRSLFLDRLLGWKSSYPQPLSRHAKRLLGQARRFARQKNWLAAERRYRLILVEAPTFAPVWIQYAHAVKEQSDLWGACGAYCHAIDLAPDDADTYVHLAHVQKRLGLLDDAVASLQGALTLCPSRLDIWEELTAFGRDIDQLVASVLESPRRFKAAGHRTGVRITLMRYRARSAAQRRDWKLAARHYRDLLKLTPDDAHTWVLFGHAVKESGDPLIAAAAYLQALVLDPVNHEPRRHFDAVRDRLLG